MKTLFIVLLAIAISVVFAALVTAGEKPEIIYVLRIDHRQPSCSGCNYSFTEKASSPESAAIILWKAKQSEGMWNSFSGRLYKIDLTNMKITRIKIPQIIFRWEGVTP